MKSVILKGGSPNSEAPPCRSSVSRFAWMVAMLDAVLFPQTWQTVYRSSCIFDPFLDDLRTAKRHMQHLALATLVAIAEVQAGGLFECVPGALLGAQKRQPRWSTAGRHPATSRSVGYLGECGTRRRIQPS